jgi:hypothetical protein
MLLQDLISASQIAIPMASSRCQQSLYKVLGLFFYRKNTCSLSKLSARAKVVFLRAWMWARSLFFSFAIEHSNLRLKYDNFFRY